MGQSFYYGNTQYTKAGATPEMFEILGFTLVPISKRPDDRFYIVSGPNDNGEYVSSPRDLEDLKLKFIMEQKRTARRLLADSDWYVLRKAETDEPIPVTVGTYRAEVRAASDVRCSEIDEVTSVEELEDLIKANEFLYDADTDEVDPNPEALTAFPENLE